MAVTGSGSKRTFTMPACGVTVKAAFDTLPAKPCTVFFSGYSQLQLIQTTVYAGEKLTDPGPSYNPYSAFDGWYYEEGGAERKWDFDKDVVHDDMILHARWRGHRDHHRHHGGRGKTASCAVTVSSMEMRVEIKEGITEVPEAFRNLPNLNTPEKIVAAMRIAVTSLGIPEENTAVYDVTLMVNDGSGWKKADASNFPAGGQDVTKPCDGGADCPSRGFADFGGVGTWYHEAVDYALRNNLMDGYSNGHFGSNDNITREQLAAILWRCSKSPAATNKELHFNDADEISGYALDAIRWAVEHGILNGFGDGRLPPA